jgi:hypothetical protein
VFDVAKTDRPIVVPEFGRLLVRARGHRTPGSVVAKVHALSPAMEGFTRPQLDRYEAGRTPRPDPVTLFFLAKHYGANLAEWIAALADERERTAVAEEKRGARTRAPSGEASARQHRRTGS